MKKTIKIMLTLAFIIAALCVTASAEAANGFYGIGSAVEAGTSTAVTGVTVTPMQEAGATDTVITATTKNVDGVEGDETWYKDSDKLAVSYTGAASGSDMGVILVEGSSLPTASSNIYYINQDEATAEGITFDVYPKEITAPSAEDKTRDFTLYISSSAEGAKLVSVPMNYVVGYEEVVTPAVTIGDVNSDTKVNGKDSVALAQYVAKLIKTINVDAANVYADTAGKINGKDTVALAQYVAKIVKVLPVMPE